MKILPRITIGTGDRFGLEGEAQLQAIIEIRKLGIDAAPVWNKSKREHSLTATSPANVRAEADAATRALSFSAPYFVDADHIRLADVPAFAPVSDFFTIDVADAIGDPVSPSDCSAFLARHPELSATHSIPGLPSPLSIPPSILLSIVSKYLPAVREAALVYQAILSARNNVDDFVTEISMDETSSPQTPAELFVILAAVSDAQIPIQTIAPKFSGEFHKGVDYIGDPSKFAEEFDADVLITHYATTLYPNLPTHLKLSVHSGSDKFSIYPAIAKSIRKHNAGVHIKTAGTTWLEEMAGLAAASPSGLALAKKICRLAFPRINSLAAPYQTVLSIDYASLPSPAEVEAWSSQEFTRHLVHDESDPLYSPSFRQFVHISYSIAAELGEEFLSTIRENHPTIASFVTNNLLNRHLKLLLE